MNERIEIICHAYECAWLRLYNASMEEKAKQKCCCAGVVCNVESEEKNVDSPRRCSGWNRRRIRTGGGAAMLRGRFYATAITTKSFTLAVIWLFGNSILKSGLGFSLDKGGFRNPKSATGPSYVTNSFSICSRLKSLAMLPNPSNDSRPCSLRVAMHRSSFCR